MLASHNSKTFNKATNCIVELFSFMWRCQDKTMSEQYERGVRFFDIRVHRTSKGSWGYCHGLANVYGGAGDLKALYNLMRTVYPDAKYRILLEKVHKESDTKLFEDEMSKLISEEADVKKYVQCFVIKNGWKVLWNNDEMNYSIVDYSWVPFTSDKPWYKQLSWKIFSNPKRWAKKHNNITEEEINDMNTLYFYDFV